MDRARFEIGMYLLAAAFVLSVLYGGFMIGVNLTKTDQVEVTEVTEIAEPISVTGEPSYWDGLAVNRTSRSKLWCAHGIPFLALYDDHGELAKVVQFDSIALAMTDRGKMIVSMQQKCEGTRLGKKDP